MNKKCIIPIGNWEGCWVWPYGTAYLWKPVSFNIYLYQPPVVPYHKKCIIPIGNFLRGLLGLTLSRDSIPLKTCIIYHVSVSASCSTISHLDKKCIIPEDCWVWPCGTAYLWDVYIPVLYIYIGVMRYHIKHPSGWPPCMPIKRVLGTQGAPQVVWVPVGSREGRGMNASMILTNI